MIRLLELLLEGNIITTNGDYTIQNEEHILYLNKLLSDVLGGKKQNKTHYSPIVFSVMQYYSYWLR
uniref:Uncharacterized protein n=1 Tax=Anguilla anguilla TaxID=7936 RepID=A0A0E9PJ45_ANGAN